MVIEQMTHFSVYSWEESKDTVWGESQKHTYNYRWS